MKDAEQLSLDLAAPAGPSRRNSWEMFDRIASRYDLLNRTLSLRQDVAWRRRVCRHMPEGTDLVLLDLATGTADQLITLIRRVEAIETGVGVDMSEGMLEYGRVKVAEAGLESRIQLKRGDATEIPFDAESFDVVTISFGIRNVVDVSGALREMHRVLRPGGRALVLEFSMPGSALLRGPYLLYLRHILPVIGGFISGDRRAYKYLNQTVESFPSGAAFTALMDEAGFTDTQAFPLTGGIASLYVGDKRSTEPVGPSP